MKVTKQQKDEALAFLKNNLNEHDTVFYIVKNVSNSGMYRHIDFYTFKVKDVFEEGENRVQKVWLSGAISKVLGYPLKEKTQSLGVSGCGMNMGFAVIYNLAEVLFGDGYKLNDEGL